MRLPGPVRPHPPHTGDARPCVSRRRPNRRQNRDLQSRIPVCDCAAHSLETPETSSLPRALAKHAKTAHFCAISAQIAAKTSILRRLTPIYPQCCAAWNAIFFPRTRRTANQNPIFPYFLPKSTPFPAKHPRPIRTSYISPIFARYLPSCNQRNSEIFSLFLPKPFSFPAKYATIKKYLSNEKERKLQ